jgi:aldehyde dehydrogenase (NAD+)
MSKSTLTSTSPQNPSDVIVTSAETDVSAVRHAAELARAAGRDWSWRPAVERSSALRHAAANLESRAREVEDLVVREIGKPRLEARGEVGRAVSILSYYAQQVLDPVGENYPPSSSGLLYTERRPLGVAGLITPWNFPIAIPLWKAAPALAAGNAVLLKPSSESLACALLLAEILNASLSGNLFTVLPGERGTAEAIIAESDVVSFTGSSAVGRQVALAATRRRIPVQAEMGGQNPAIVLRDADLEKTAAQLVAAAMGFAGQKCTATRRIITLGDEGVLVEALSAALSTAVPGDPDDEATTVGPVITRAAQQTLEQSAREASRSGGHVVTGGDVPEVGWFVAPRIVTGLKPDHRLLQEETFGPFVTVSSAESVAEAVRLANGVKYGLVSSLYGRDLDAILETVRQLDTGMIKVNVPTTGVDFYLPFGGEKESSAGPREQGKAAMNFYSSSRTITISSIT